MTAPKLSPQVTAAAAPTCRNATGTPDPDLCSKYCGDHPFNTECEGCGEPVTVTYAGLEVLGPYHAGCFGYPACMCTVPHKGQCAHHPQDLLADAAPKAKRGKR